MPLEKIIRPDPGTVLGIWKIDEDEGSLSDLLQLSPHDSLTALSFKNKRRKEQWLACRMILKEIYGVAFSLEYDDSGKPYLANDPDMDLSFTHSGDYAAVILSRTRCVGIDIERVRDRILRVKERFLSEQEMEDAIRTGNTEKLYVYWGAKEALYKINGKPDIDFQKDLIIHPFDYLCAGQCTASIRSGGRAGNYTICYEMTGNYILVYAMGNR